MVTTYRIAGWVIAGMVMVQAAVIVFAVAGLFAFVSQGGTVSAATEPDAIPEGIGVSLHILLANYFFPFAGLAMVVIAAFTKRALAIWMAVALLVLILLEWLLGVTGYSAPIAGLLHGANGLLIFGLCMLMGLGMFTRPRVGDAGAISPPGGRLAATRLPAS